MYEVMARRYRPATFDEVVGQEHIANTLKNAITRDRVAHAFMFTGGHGCGKTTMARILAKALVCQHGPTPNPCGTCNICTDVAAGRDSDVLEIDGASNNGIEQIRQLREQAAYVPTRARFKIYIIDEVHMLSDGAFNALLKTLEEPPRHVKFILATTDPHKVPDTILSRCQRFDFRLVPAAKLSEFFRRLASQENAAITDEALDAVAANAEGSVRDGLVLLDQLLSFSDGEVQRADVEAVRGVAAAENIAGIFSAIARADVKSALAIVDEVSSRGTNVGDFLDQLIAFGRDLMLFSATGSADGVSAYGPAKKTLLELGPATPLESALLYLDVLAQARTRVRSRALSNPLVALEMAVARLAGLGGVTPVAEILAKLGSVPPSSPAAKPAPPTQNAPAEKKTPEPAPAAAPATPPAPTEKPGPAATTKPVPPEPRPATPPAPAPSTAARPEPRPAPEPEPDFDEPEFEPDLDAAVPRNMAKTIAPLTDEQVTNGWDAVLNRVAEKHPADFRHLSRLAPDGARGNTIVLAGPATAVEAMGDRHRAARLAETAARVFRRDVAFELVARTAARPTPAEDNPEATYNLSRHPTVGKIRDLFDGVIVNCQPTAAQDGQDEGEQAEESP